MASKKAWPMEGIGWLIIAIASTTGALRFRAGLTGAGGTTANDAIVYDFGPPISNRNLRAIDDYALGEIGQLVVEVGLPVTGPNLFDGVMRTFAGCIDQVDGDGDGIANACCKGPSRRMRSRIPSTGRVAGKLLEGGNGSNASAVHAFRG